MSLIKSFISVLIISFRRCIFSVLRIGLLAAKNLFQYFCLLFSCFWFPRNTLLCAAISKQLFDDKSISSQIKKPSRKAKESMTMATSLVFSTKKVELFDEVVNLFSAIFGVYHICALCSTCVSF